MHGVQGIAGSNLASQTNRSSILAGGLLGVLEPHVGSTILEVFHWRGRLKTVKSLGHTGRHATERKNNSTLVTNSLFVRHHTVEERMMEQLLQNIIMLHGC